MKIVKILLITIVTPIICNAINSNVSQALAAGQNEIQQMQKNGQILIKGPILSNLENKYGLSVSVIENVIKGATLARITSANADQGILVTISKPMQIVIKRTRYNEIVCEGIIDVKPGDILNLDCNGKDVIRK